MTKQKLKTKKEYKWRGSTEFIEGDAQVVGERIDFLMDKNSGEITADIMVKDATPKNSPIHKYFDWDDSSAAHKFRMVRARTMLGNIVSVMVIGGKPENIRGFFNVHNEVNEKVYVKIETVGENQSYKDQLLEDAENYIKHFMRVIKLINNL